MAHIRLDRVRLLNPVPIVAAVVIAAVVQQQAGTTVVIELPHGDVLVDESLSIMVSGLTPKAVVTLRARRANDTRGRPVRRSRPIPPAVSISPGWRPMRGATKKSIRWDYSGPRHA
jgi:hypothetical protein